MYTINHYSTVNRMQLVLYNVRLILVFEKSPKHLKKRGKLIFPIFSLFIYYKLMVSMDFVRLKRQPKG